MKFTPICFLIFMLASSGSCLAQTNREDHIDEEYRQCLLRDTAYVNISDCSFKAFEQWHKEMSKAYDKLLDKLKKEKDRTAMKQAQSAWLAYKDAEFNSYDYMFNLPGNKMSLMRAEARIEVVRERTLQLRAYIEALK